MEDITSCSPPIVVPRLSFTVNFSQNALDQKTPAYLAPGKGGHRAFEERILERNAEIGLGTHDPAMSSGMLRRIHFQHWYIPLRCP